MVKLCLCHSALRQRAASVAQPKPFFLNPKKCFPRRVSKYESSHLFAIITLLLLLYPCLHFFIYSFFQGIYYKLNYLLWSLTSNLSVIRFLSFVRHLMPRNDHLSVLNQFQNISVLPSILHSLGSQPDNIYCSALFIDSQVNNKY